MKNKKSPPISTASPTHSRSKEIDSSHRLRKAARVLADMTDDIENLAAEGQLQDPGNRGGIAEDRRVSENGK